MQPVYPFWESEKTLRIGNTARVEFDDSREEVNLYVRYSEVLKKDEAIALAVEILQHYQQDLSSFGLGE